ncbi:MAG: YbaB/EbfC family nucleoid-associated protein [Spirochaetaceae bacterium]|jgi:DNA-binding YbaB/EbfC family protein|nr:YbaB/EbfC family nucleoid-associated protein [Spirochaetaceae bacterium]
MNINPFDLLKNAQKLQEQMGSFQEKLGGIRATGSSGGGMVEVELNGRLEFLAIRISPEAVDPREVEMLQDLIVAAFTAAMEKTKEAINAEMGALAGGMGISGFPGLS